MSSQRLSLAFGLSFEDLYDESGLARLDGRFVTHLRQMAPSLAERLLAARGGRQRASESEQSELLLELAPWVQRFISALFGIELAVEACERAHRQLDPIYEVKRAFVQRRAARAVPPAVAAELHGDQLLPALALPAPAAPDFELAFARAVLGWQQDADANRAPLDAAERYAAWALHSPAGRERHGSGVLFQVPRKLDPQRLVRARIVVQAGQPTLAAEDDRLQERDGFELTDRGCNLAGALDQAHYCIGCHRQRKDSCSKGFRQPDGAFRHNDAGVALTGCPLEEHISEFLTLQAQGLPISALALIMVRNPLVAATGHRICNDCMKACIYQKQEPVDIPQAETRVLRDVLGLTWGFEIYSLLSRWNPLNLERPLPRSSSGYKVLVVGLGPAGFTLAHHLLNEGHTVVAIDGLKIEPLAAELSGVDAFGGRAPFRPIEHAASLHRAASERTLGGFGGVAEYGITARWDKNFLTVIRMLLERRASFAMIGGVRFGGTLTIDDAFAAGFDHIALCMGAGRPTILPLAQGFARGVRQASDFLMALQLGGAARADSVANLQVRLPIVVIGGGLTAIDAATESLAYYPVQVERFLARHEVLVGQRGQPHPREDRPEDEHAMTDEFIAHAKAIRAERQRAGAEGREARISDLLREWGGATIAYRRRLVDAPSYRLNHEEVAHALRQGVRFLEGATPVAVLTDDAGHARELRVLGEDGHERGIQARTILVAAGTQPNTALAAEESAHLRLHGRHFQTLDAQGALATALPHGKPDLAHVLTSHCADGRAISFFGDLHPSFAGNVVKAMASALRGAPVISASLARRSPTSVPGDSLIATMQRELRAVVERVERLTPSIVEVIVRAPRAAQRFRPGQFFRLQGFEVFATRVDGTLLAMEPLALTGASVDVERGTVSVIVLETGGSAALCRVLRPGDPVILMGPTGAPTVIPRDRTVCLIGGGLGNAVLFSIGQAARARGNKVIYFAGYKRLEDRFKVEQIEAASDLVVWSCDESPGFTPARPEDRSHVGNVVESMLAYASARLGPPAIPLRDVDRMVVIGSDRMMAAVAAARRTLLAPYLASDHEAIGSINSPMQCMMKEICGQCVQRHYDAATGREWVVFSCVNQDQPLDHVDFDMLAQRLAQNRVQEKLTAAWVDRCIAQLPDPPR